MTETEINQGGCLCGAVRYEVEGPLQDICYCHCGQCQKATGHYYASSAVATGRFRLTRRDGLKWYKSSNWGERGFCGDCGSPLFWKLQGTEDYSFLVGSLDGDPTLKGGKHIFVDDKKSYYHLDDGLPQYGGAPKRAEQK